MAKIGVNRDEVAKSIESLKGLYERASGSGVLELEFQGDFTFTKYGEELGNMMEETRVLWYNIANQEAAALNQVVDTITKAEAQISRTIGKRYGE